MYVNTTAEVKAQTDYCCTSSNAVDVVEHIYATHGEDTEILFGPDMLLGAYVEKETGRRDARVGRRVPRARRHPPGRHRRDMRAAHPGADFLIHPECGCSTSVMEYVAAGDVAAEGVHMLSTGGMLELGRGRAAPGTTAIVATETGMLHPLRMARARRGLHRRQRGGQLPLHEDDHAAEAARRAARRWRRRCKVPGRDRRARARCRSSAWSRSARRPPPSAAQLDLLEDGVAADGVQLGLLDDGARESARTCRSSRPRRLVVVARVVPVVRRPWSSPRSESSDACASSHSISVVSSTVPVSVLPPNRLIVSTPPVNDAILPACSAPSLMPSPSVSALRGLVWARNSARLRRPS